jgi:hypothetical protein
MSQVHNVTHDPVHSPTARIGFRIRVSQHARAIGEGVAGRNVPQRRVAEEAKRLESGRSLPPQCLEASVYKVTIAAIDLVMYKGSGSSLVHKVHSLRGAYYADSLSSCA